MKPLNRIYSIPNNLIIQNTDSEIFTFIVINLEKKYNKCQVSQETMVEKYGQYQAFYSTAVNNLDPDYIKIYKTFCNGGQKENNKYTINVVEDDFTMLYIKIFNKIFNIENEKSYKTLAFYLNLRRWINDDKLYAKSLTKKQIAEYSYCSKNTCNMYLKKLEELELVKIEKGKKLNTFTITLLGEIEIKEDNKRIKNENKLEKEELLKALLLEEKYQIQIDEYNKF